MAGGVFSGVKLNAMTIRESATDGSDFTNPDADYRRLFLGEDGLLHVKDSAGTVSDPFTGAGSVATDTLWDAAGDLAVGSGANTAARLAIGNAGAVLARINGAAAWNAGTAFPTAANNDRFWRTDLDLEAFYDGTRWLTTQQFQMGIPNLGTTISAANRPTFPSPHGTYDIFVERLAVSLHVATTNTGAAYWTAKLQRNVVNTWVDVGTTVDTSAAAPDDWTLLTLDIDTVVTLANHAVFGVLLDKVGAPGNATATASVFYRLVLT